MKHTDVYACHKVKIRREIMVHHIVLWNWKEGLAEAEKKEAAAKIKDRKSVV